MHHCHNHLQGPKLQKEVLICRLFKKFTLVMYSVWIEIYIIYVPHCIAPYCIASYRISSYQLWNPSWNHFRWFLKEGLSAAFILIPFELRRPCRAICNRLMGNQNDFKFLWNPFWSHFRFFKGSLSAAVILIPFELKALIELSLAEWWETKMILNFFGILFGVISGFLKEVCMLHSFWSLLS